MYHMEEYRSNHKKGTVSNKKKNINYIEKHPTLQKTTFSYPANGPFTAVNENCRQETVIQRKGVVPLSAYCPEDISLLPTELAELVRKYDNHDFSLEDFIIIAKISSSDPDREKRFLEFKQFVKTGYENKQRLKECLDTISQPPAKFTGSLSDQITASQEFHGIKHNARSEIDKIYLSEQMNPYAEILKNMELHLLVSMREMITKLTNQITCPLIQGITHELDLVTSQISSFPDPIPDPFSYFSSSRTLRQHLSADSPLRELDGIDFFARLSDETARFLESTLSNGLITDAKSELSETYDAGETSTTVNFTNLKRDFESIVLKQTELAHYTNFKADLPIIMSHDALEKSRINLRQTNTSSKTDARQGEFVSKSQAFDINLRNTDFVFFFLDLIGSQIKRTFGRYRYSIPFSETDEHIMALLDDLSAPYDRWNKNESDSPTDLSLRSRLKYTIHYDSAKKELTHHQLSAENGAAPSQPPTLKVPPLQTVIYGKTNIAKIIALRGTIHIKMLLEAGNINFVSDILNDKKKKAEFLTSIMKVQIMVPRFAIPQASRDMGPDWCPAK